MTICATPEFSVGLCQPDADLYGQAALHLLPSGPAWPKEPGSAIHALYAKVIGRLMHALAERACLLLPELDPCTAVATRERWQAIYASPDCPSLECREPEEVLTDLCLRARLAHTRQAPDVIALAADLGFTAAWEAQCPPVFPICGEPVCTATAGTPGQNMVQILSVTAGPAMIERNICEAHIGWPHKWRPGMAALRCLVEILRPAHTIRTVEDRIDP